MKIHKMINELISSNIFSREEIAVKMHVSASTIYNWQMNKTLPTYAERKMVTQIYNAKVSKEG